MDILDLDHGAVGEGPPLVILHGLFGSRRNWGVIARGLSSARRVITVDLRNHGGSPWSDRMDYPAMAGDVAALLDRLSPGAPVEIIGHSMGGKVVMALALTRPTLVSRPIIVDIGPATYDEGFSVGFAALMREIEPARHTNRREIDDELAGVVSDPALRGFLMTNIARDGDRFRWTVNLEAIIANKSALLGFPELPGSYGGPALFIAGARSNYLNPEAEGLAKTLFPSARVVRLKDADHWVHADAPDAFVKTVAAFLGIERAAP